MVDLNKQRIATLTKTASSTPVLQTNQGSDAGDAIQALSFGLNAISQHQAKNELADNAERARIQEERIAKAGNAYSTFLTDLSNGNLGAVGIRRRKEKFFSDANFTEVEKAQVIAFGQKQSDTNVTSIGKSAASALEKEQTHLQNQREDLAELASFYPDDSSTIPQLEGNKLDNALIMAKAEKAKFDAAAAENMVRANGVGEKKTAIGANFANGVGLAQVNSMSEAVKGFDLTDINQRNQVIELLRQGKDSLPVALSQVSAQAGYPIRSSDASTYLTGLNSMYDSLISRVNQEDFQKLDNADQELQASLTIRKLVERGDEGGTALWISKYGKIPLDISNKSWMQSELTKSLNGLGKVSTATAIADLEQEMIKNNVPQGTIDSVKKAYQKSSTQQGVGVKEYTPEESQVVFDTFMQDLNPSTEDGLTSSINSGVALDHIKALADKDKGAMLSSKKQEIKPVLDRVNAKYMDFLGTALLSETSPMIKRTEDGVSRVTEVKKVIDQYDYNPDTNQFESKGNYYIASHDNSVVKINAYLNNTKQAYDSLGLDSEDFVSKLTELLEVKGMLKREVDKKEIKVNRKVDSNKIRI